MEELSWTDALVRAVVALTVFAVLFVAARYRWKKQRDSDQGSADLGLD